VKAKIECAREFFVTLNEKSGDDVKYDVVTDYTELMQLVAGWRRGHFTPT
jgi:type III restriction enzyme